MPKPVYKRDQSLFKLSDRDLSKLDCSIQQEVKRRIWAAVSGVDLLEQIKGQEMAKRALLIAAQGKHSILFIGPHGCGKTMLRAAGYSLGLTRSYEAISCPCGNRNDPRSPCTCSVKNTLNFMRLWPHTEITIEVTALPEREMASQLLGTSLKDLQKQMRGSKESKDRILNEECRNLLKASVAELGFSVEQRVSILAITRTIADLDRSGTIEPSHLCEAINYRMLRHPA